MKIKVVAIVMLAFLGYVGTAQADCVCRCVNGKVQPLCQNSLDVPTVCLPTLCPPDVPLIAPRSAPSIPPIGAKSCRQARICDKHGDCRWRKVCR